MLKEEFTHLTTLWRCYGLLRISTSSNGICDVRLAWFIALVSQVSMFDEDAGCQPPVTYNCDGTWLPWVSRVPTIVKHTSDILWSTDIYIHTRPVQLSSYLCPVMLQHGLIAVTGNNNGL